MKNPVTPLGMFCSLPQLIEGSVKV